MILPEASATPEPWGAHLSDSELLTKSYPELVLLMQKMDKDPGAWLVPEGHAPRNPIRALLRRITPEGSELRALANEPAEQPDWQSRVEPDPSPRDTGKH